MRILAIDPGPEMSAFAEIVAGNVADCGIAVNGEILDIVRVARPNGFQFCIEGIQSYGMAVGKETFQTCIWIGRFIERFGGEHHLIYRSDVKLHFCKSMRAKDANIRQAIIDRYGGKDKAIGKKKTPGPLYGVKSHCWSALAVGLVYLDQAEVKA